MISRNKEESKPRAVAWVFKYQGFLILSGPFISKIQNRDLECFKMS